MTDRPATVAVQSLHKSYGDFKAVEDLSFSVFPGEIFGLLGPNGAGKTTTLEMIEGLRRPDGGQILVAGIDAQNQPRAVREIIGVQLQQTSLYNNIRVEEALRLFGGYYRTQKPVEELLDLVSLQDKRHSFHKNLSGGQQQRLALALALVNDPLIIFLDEPTTGLDPQARRNLWDIILKMRSADKSIILTTHYMEEAERLCDRIAIMDHGRVIAQGSPKELIGQLKVDSCIEFLSEGNADPEQLQKLPGVSRVTVIHQRVEIFSEAPQTTLTALLALSNTAGFAIGDLHIRRATLEDLFIELTGRSLRE